MDLVGGFERGVNRLIASVYHRRFGRERRRGGARRRGFDGADNGRLFANWTTTLQLPDNLIKKDLSALQARSRDQFYNNPYIRRYVQLCQSNIVGPGGVKYQARALGRGGKLDRPANENLEEAFREWGRPENCDFDGRLSWVEKQRQAIMSAAIDGEILARIYTGTQYGRYGIFVHHLDVGLLNPAYNIDLRSGGYIRMGIEFNARGRVVAYHLRQQSRTSDSYTGYDNAQYARVVARDIVHAFLPHQVGQHRGYPWVAPALAPLKMLDAYYEAAVAAARAGASKMGFITTPDGAPYDGDDIDEDGNPISEFETGIIEQLGPGEEFSAFDPRYPHEQFDAFVKACLRQSCAALNVAYSSLSGDLEKVNYSSSKIGLGEERANWMVLQEWFIDSYIRPIFDRWIAVAHMSGAVTVAGKPLSGSLEKYRRASGQGRRWSSPDPAKDAAAHKAYLEMGATSVSAIINETTGRDPEEVFKERDSDKEAMRMNSWNNNMPGSDASATEGVSDEDKSDEAA